MSTDKVVPRSSSPPPKTWVQFEEGNTQESATPKKTGGNQENGTYSGAVIDAETVEVSINKAKQHASSPAPASQYTPVKPKNAVTAQPKAVISSNGEVYGSNVAASLRNVDLSEGHGSSQVAVNIDGTIRQGFANGDVIVSILPVNTKWPWITPAEFRPELVPEELMAHGLTLTIEDYVQIMEVLVNDARFTVYNICYKRLLIAWLCASFLILLGLLFSGAKGLTLFGCGVVWLVINGGAIFACMWLKTRMNRHLEKAISKANQSLIRHKIILGLDNRGKLSCHKVNLCFVYFDTAECIKKLQEVIENEEAAGRRIGTEDTAEDRKKRQQFKERMDIDDTDIVITGSTSVRVSRKQERARMLLLRYSQRWARELVRHNLDLGQTSAPVGVGGVAPLPPPPPRHCATARCLCQFIEEHLYYKAHGGKCTPRNCCNLPTFGFD